MHIYIRTYTLHMKNCWCVLMFEKLVWVHCSLYCLWGTFKAPTLDDQYATSNRCLQYLDFFRHWYPSTSVCLFCFGSSSLLSQEVFWETRKTRHPLQDTRSWLAQVIQSASRKVFHCRWATVVSLHMYAYIYIYIVYICMYNHIYSIHNCFWFNRLFCIYIYDIHL